MQKIKEASLSVRLTWFFLIVGVVLITLVGALLLYYDTTYEQKALPASVYQPSAVSEPQTEADEQNAYVGEKLNINRASIEQLKTLPGVGDALAKRIVDFREKTPFKVVRDLKKVSGIGEKKFQEMAELVCVEETGAR